MEKRLVEGYNPSWKPPPPFNDNQPTITNRRSPTSAIHVAHLDVLSRRIIIVLKFVEMTHLDRTKGEQRSEPVLRMKLLPQHILVHQSIEAVHQGHPFHAETGKFVREREHKGAQREEVHPLGQRVDHVQIVAGLE